MYKYFFFIFMSLFAIFVSLMSCEKRTPLVAEYNHCAQEIPNDKKTGTLFSITTLCGHTISECGGNCMMTPFGHADCQGPGSSCTMSANILVEPTASSSFIATTQDSTDLTSEEFFNMPDRSLYTGLDGDGKPCWLNIPAQLAIRDSVTRLFTFSGVFYSSQQVYKNL